MKVTLTQNENTITLYAIGATPSISSDAVSLQGKVVDISAIADSYGLVYELASDTLVFQALSGNGTVTSVAAGNGLDFTTITGAGSVVLGTPGTITGSTTNAVTATSHTHQFDESGISITASQVTDFDTEVANNVAVVANTAKVTFPGFTSLITDYGVILATVATSGVYGDLSGTPTIPTISDVAYDATSWDGNTDGATKNAIRDKIESLGGGHDPVTLNTNADALLSLSTQELGLDTQSPNLVFAGPATGGATVPTFRSLVSADIPNLSGTYLTLTGDGSGLSGVVTSETDPIVGAITGIVKADGAGNISAAVSGTDYAAALGTDDNYVTNAEKTKLGYISITQAVDLDAIETRVNELDASVILMGIWDASIGTFPGSGTAQAGESWIVSVGGTVDSQVFVVNDRIVAILDNASTTIYASNWHKLDYTDQVFSVAGKTGAVTLTTVDIAASTDKNYVTDAQLVVIGNTSGTNTGDQDASGVNITDAGGYFTGTETETALQESGEKDAYADSPGIITGGAITEGTTAGTYKVAALTAFLRSTSSATAPLVKISLPEQDNQTITVADTTYYIILDYNAGSPQIVLSAGNPYESGADYTQIPIGKVTKDGSNNVHYISGGYDFQDGVKKLHTRAKHLRGYELSTGSTIAYSGTNNFTMTPGLVFGGLNKYTLGAYDSAITTFTPVYQDGIGGWTEGTASNIIDYLHYDDGDGTLGNVGNAKYGCFWIYRHIDDGDVYVVYGRDSYALAEAEEANEPSKPAHLTDFGILVGKIIAPQAGGSFTEIQMVTDKIFSGASVATHNNLGGLQGGTADEYYHLTSAEYTAQSKRIFSVRVVDEGTALDGTETFVWHVPEEFNLWNIVNIQHQIDAPSTSGALTFTAVNMTDTTTITSTNYTIDATEYSTNTAATPGVINTSYDDIATDDKITLGCSVAGTGSAGWQFTVTIQKA